MTITQKGTNCVFLVENNIMYNIFIFISYIYNSLYYNNIICCNYTYTHPHAYYLIMLFFNLPIESNHISSNLDFHHVPQCPSIWFSTAHPQLPPGLDPPPEPVEKVPQGPPGSCRSSMSSERRRFSDVQLGAEGVGS